MDQTGEDPMTESIACRLLDRENGAKRIEMT